MGLWGTGGAQGVKHGHVVYQIDGDDKQNRMQVKFSWGQRSNIIIFRLPYQFQRFLYQILCVFSQMKDTKHIRRDFYYVAWVIPQRWDFWALGVYPEGQTGCFFFKHGHVTYQIDGDDEQNKMQVTFFILGSNW